ncbi:restriction endonuclease [Oscillatoria sp. FACHB-1406]|nr:restriction endonuclease [Oscillatoria sp. FACHB-1406]
MLLPIVRVLLDLGGSGTREEIYEGVVQLLNLSEEVLEIMQGNTSQSAIKCRLSWSLSYLKYYGLLENSKRGIWSLLDPEIKVNTLDPKEIVKVVRDRQKNKQKDSEVAEEISEVSESLSEITWEQELHQALLKLEPSAFERLVQKLLRESGFIQVRVTGKSGDGGIDGIGIARINGFLSFQVLFQCKRYSGAVSASQVRDFRGAMQGRTDKGLLITTGTFTQSAIAEAQRDGAPPIDLIDGEQLVRRLKELGLGIKITLVESVKVDRDWFVNL